MEEKKEQVKKKGIKLYIHIIWVFLSIMAISFVQLTNSTIEAFIFALIGLVGLISYAIVGLKLGDKLI